MDMVDDGPYVIRTIGFFLDSVKLGHVAVAQSIDRESNVDSVVFIPEQMIEKIVDLSSVLVASNDDTQRMASSSDQPVSPKSRSKR